MKYIQMYIELKPYFIGKSNENNSSPPYLYIEIAS